MRVTLLCVSPGVARTPFTPLATPLLAAIHQCVCCNGSTVLFNCLPGSPILTHAGTGSLASLPPIQHRIWTGCGSAQGKGNSFPLPQVMLQQPHWGFSDLCHLRRCHRSKKPRAALGCPGPEIGSRIGSGTGLTPCSPMAHPQAHPLPLP